MRQAEEKVILRKMKLKKSAAKFPYVPSMEPHFGELI